MTSLLSWATECQDRTQLIHPPTRLAVGCWNVDEQGNRPNNKRGSSSGQAGAIPDTLDVLTCAAEEEVRLKIVIREASRGAIRRHVRDRFEIKVNASFEWRVIGRHIYGSGGATLNLNAKRDAFLSIVAYCGQDSIQDCIVLLAR
uniref:Uncharacterized protein n=1 Tax=Vitrella brassicaformis TaxID=1169539 RepID=A0A7S1P973_9ALVE|mmetsp:Transcript_42766/g.106856  ORF Transcript_42766/g.106856 Transcript_42766/m.106856 type:complete len:145 (+) Transcript_42766:521-955(+)